MKSLFASSVTIALRKIVREKFYVFICVASLALGVTCALVISLYLHSEITYDQYHENYERIYKVNTALSDVEIPVSGHVVGALLVQDNVDIVDSVRFRSAPEKTFTFDQNTILWDDIYLADPSVFSVFTINVIHGDKQTALADPNSIAISESFSRIYFGDENPLGRVLSTAEHYFRVTLVYENLPENVELHHDALLPMSLVESYAPAELTDYFQRFVSGSTTYLLVSDTFNPETFDEVSQRFFETHMAAGYPPGVGSFELQIQPLTSVYYGKQFPGEGKRGNIVNLYGLSALAAFLLLIACVNYINITTARATKRAREVGVRKVLGAQKHQLVIQFLGESFFMCTLGFLTAIIMTVCVLETGIINDLTGKSELLKNLFSSAMLSYVGVSWIFVSLISGLYPAFHLSRTSVLSGLMNQIGSGPGMWNVRQLLVLFQLVISSSVIICVLMMENQVRFVLNSPLGFEKDNQLVARLQGADVLASLPAIRAELASHNEIVSVTTAQRAPGRGLNVSINDIESNDGTDVSTVVHTFAVGADYLDALGIELIQGREFSDDMTTESPVLVNETLVRQMEWEQPIGKQIGGGEIVVGVFKDFHYLSLHEPIGPMVLRPTLEDFSQLTPQQREDVNRELLIGISGNNVEETQRFIRETLERFTDNPATQLTLLDESWRNFYEEDLRATKMARVFAVISIGISLLGLIGLSAYATEQRSKEIAVRKILGASVGQVLRMLSKSTLALTALAAIPASLASYYAIEFWLARFAYRTEIGLAPFLIAFTAIAVISVATVSLQSYRAVSANPAEKLRYE
ncbi:MAG: FtsX-like permease family protein [Gammaproteobacteria bacterium]|nr:FtsX-like permease family protein [Gammaproteobacteria bacterium]